ncbi:hypothetical protein VaNZ11_006524 [Volvox africanus]|uniref:TIP41-like protein n=1 Tax=Volvox africanus TaxID=51714 RepID=A0ABQ5S1L1_9CHLO|nr:hypothetical protein VaNZ11_006524 [Volvox africanus]
MPNSKDTFHNAGWTIRTVTGPIMGDKEMDEYRRVLSAFVLPEMVFAQNRVELVHEASGTVISFNALDALAGWKHEDLPPLQVRVAEEWRKAREYEIKQQKALQLTYDWTYTTPYTCTVARRRGQQQQQQQPALAVTAAPDSIGAHGIPDFVCGADSTAAAAPRKVTVAANIAEATLSSSSDSNAAGVDAGAATEVAPVGGSRPSVSHGTTSDLADGADGGALWQPTTDQIDRGLLMERDPILFYCEVPLYESDLDDNGVCSLAVKLRVMPRCWLVLLRLWIRVDGSLVRLRETRLFCRHDKRLEVLQEVKHCEGTFAELRARGAPDEGPSYIDGDAASQVCVCGGGVVHCVWATRPVARTSTGDPDQGDEQQR